ncbi:MAG: restriction endonuclease [Actinomycetota bacterium]|nr:restriction endonuclease [Actinomycetota bacterium]
MRDLIGEYRRLQQSENPHARGRALETVVTAAFRNAHFTVRRNAGAAIPRQTDLVAIRGHETYLVETKWQRPPVDIEGLDSLSARLGRVDPAVTGVFISVSGFTEPVVDEVRLHRKRPILLVSGAEFEAILEGNLDLVTVLRDKRRRLVIDAEVDQDSGVERRAWLTGPVDEETAASPIQFQLPDGRRTEVLACGGDFGQFVFVESLFDVDWVQAQGNGVVLDLRFELRKDADLVRLVNELAGAGWSGGLPRWNIQQAATNWHGIGSRAFADALLGWEARYAGLDSIHHTEEVSYHDEIDGGFYTLTADVSARDDRRVYYSNLSMQLLGIPLDLEPLQHLHQHIDPTAQAFFRPLSEPSVTAHGFPLGSSRIYVSPRALLVRRDEIDKEEWVIGVAVENPFRGSRSDASSKWPSEKEWPFPIADTELLICDLRSHHPLSEPKPSYFLRHAHTSWTADVLVFHVVADW